MGEPSPRTSRLAIAGTLLAAIALGGSGFLLGRETAPAPPPPSTPSALAPGPVTPVSSEAPGSRILSRKDLIAFGNAAADAAASGPAPTLRLAEASGQRFELFLPFGCDGPAPEDSDAALRWRYDAAASALRVHVAPTSWPPEAWWQTPPPGVEAIEGFWIARPWSSRETCASGGSNSAPPGIEPITLPGQTLGVAQVVTAETSRQARRDGRPYEAVVQAAPETLRLEAGLRVRLRGRIASFPAGEVVRCAQPGGREQRPVCLIAVSLDEVAVENPATQETLAAWTPTVAGPAEHAPR